MTGPAAQTARGTVARLGEEAAAQHLARNGYAILARNYRCRAGEIDVVARDPSGSIVFVEVRARSGATFGTPEESITTVKSGKMVACAMTYLAEHGAEQDWRIDFVGVDVRQGRVVRLRHLKHALG